MGDNRLKRYCNPVISTSRIEFTKKIMKKSKHNILIGIQNFLVYKQGRNPTKQISWDKFMDKLKTWEKTFLNLPLF